MIFRKDLTVYPSAKIITGSIDSFLWRDKVNLIYWQFVNFAFMALYDFYFQQFNEKVPLTKEEQEQIQSYLTLKKLRRKQYFLQEGEVCKSYAFVKKGSLRKYSIENGNEHIIQFAIEGWTVGDLMSFLNDEPANYHIETLEDSELVLLSKSAHDELLSIQPKYETYFRLLITGAYIALQRRHSFTLSLPVEQRYTDFVETYPEIVCDLNRP